MLPRQSISGRDMAFTTDGGAAMQKGSLCRERLQTHALYLAFGQVIITDNKIIKWKYNRRRSYWRHPLPDCKGTTLSTKSLTSSRIDPPKLKRSPTQSFMGGAEIHRACPPRIQQEQLYFYLHRALGHSSSPSDIA